MNEPATKQEALPDFFANTKWFDQYFIPFGRTTREEFGRGWLMIFLGQLAVVIVGLALLFVKQVILGITLLLVAFVVGGWAIAVLHVRRAHDAGQNGWLSLLLLVPMVLSLLLVISPIKDTAKAEQLVEKSAQSSNEKGASEQKKAVSNRDARRAISQKQSRRHGRRGRSVGSGPNGQKKEPNLHFAKGIAMAGIYGLAGLLLSLVSFLSFWQKWQEPRRNQWGEPGVTLRR